VQKSLAPFPLVRVLVPLVLGIAISFSIDAATWLLAILLGTALLGFIISSRLIKRASLFYSWNGLFVSAFFFTGGLLIAEYRDHMQTTNAASVITEVPVHVRIISDPETKESNVRCRAEVIAVYTGSSWHTVESKTMLYLKRNPAAEKMQYGDELVVKSGLKFPSPVMNPGEFDYAGWLRGQGINFVCFARDEWKHTGHTEGSWIKAQALALRRYFKSRLIACGLTGQELAVSEALLLGQSSDIDPGLLASYSASGTLHVLSVSGMHVALVFVVLLKLLAPLEKKKRTRWISFAIQFFVIWFYAFMTGMSPSVLRSVMMLSVIITGNMINRKGHLLNTLAASAIILLVGNPMLLKDAGFLLSYCAVAGIVLVQPLIEKWWTPRSRFIKPVWSLISVTLAAQIFTFPLGLYFFQQFPTWFLLSNLVVIPLSTICLYAGLFLLCISWWTWAASLFAIVFGFLIGLLNSSVSFTEYVPAAVIETSSWSGFEILLLYLGILFLLVAVQMKKRKIIFGTMTAMLVLFLSIAAGRHTNFSSRQITIFHINKGMAIGVQDGKSVTIFTDSATLSKPDLLNYHVFPMYERMGIREPEIIETGRTDSLTKNVITFYRGCIFTPQQRIWIGGKFDVPPNPVSCDVLVIHGKNFWMIEKLRMITAKEIVLTGEVKPKWIAKWEEEAKRRAIPVHVTSQNGALSVTVP